MNDDFKNLTTEKISPKSQRKDLNIKSLINDFIDEYDSITASMKKNKNKISKAVDFFVKTYSSGGNIYFLGAGTSGRLGILEAAECPPTFGTNPKRIVGIIAGGKSAVFKSKEGAEDSGINSLDDLMSYSFNSDDLLIGISASGKSEYVLSGIKYAKKIKAPSILISCNQIKNKISDLDIVLNVGPEFISGSTRLKSGTATKNLLNIITSVSMIRLEKIYKNVMIEISPTTRKLKARLIRNLSFLLNIDQKLAIKLLEKSKWSIRLGLIMHKMNVSYKRAKILSREISIVEMLDGK